MAKVDTTAIRRFLDPVSEAGEARKTAADNMEGVISMSASRRGKVVKAFEKADKAYAEAVGELIGGVTKLVEDAEAEQTTTEG